MDKVHELDTKCIDVQTALEEEKSRNAKLLGEVNSNKSKVRKLIYMQQGYGRTESDLLCCHQLQEEQKKLQEELKTVRIFK